MSSSTSSQSSISSELFRDWRSRSQSNSLERGTVQNIVPLRHRRWIRNAFKIQSSIYQEESSPKRGATTSTALVPLYTTCITRLKVGMSYQDVLIRLLQRINTVVGPTRKIEIRLEFRRTSRSCRVVMVTEENVGRCLKLLAKLSNAKRVERVVLVVILKVDAHEEGYRDLGYEDGFADDEKSSSSRKQNKNGSHAKPHSRSVSPRHTPPRESPEPQNAFARGELEDTLQCEQPSLLRHTSGRTAAASQNQLRLAGTAFIEDC